MSGWVCQWKLWWIPVEDSFKRAFVEECVFISDEPSDGQNTVDVPFLHDSDHSEYIPVTPRASKQFTSLPWESAQPQDKACFWERIEAPLPPLRPRPKCNFIHPRQLSPFPERLVLPLSNEVILSGYEEFDSSGTELFTSWVKMSEHEILVQHMVDVQKAFAEFREASERKHATSSHKNSSSKHFATRSIVQRRDLASTVGALDPVGEKKMPSNNNLLECVISLPCKKRLTTLTTSFSRIAST